MYACVPVYMHAYMHELGAQFVVKMEWNLLLDKSIIYTISVTFVLYFEACKYNINMYKTLPHYITISLRCLSNSLLINHSEIV